MRLKAKNVPAQGPASPAPTYAQLLSLAVHEFRTPASVLGGYLRMLQRDTRAPLDDRQRHMIDEAANSCARMVALIGELNEVAKLDDPLVALPRESFDLFAMLREVADDDFPETAERGVQLKTRGAAAGAAITGDIVRLHAAFGAFFRAVLREQADRSVVLVDYRLARKGKSASALIVVAGELALAGAAAGTPCPFDERRGGLGLALPIARRVIERHGGRVWSPPSEKGAFGSKSAVLISLPVT